MSKHCGAQKIQDCLLPCATPEDAMVCLQRDLVEDLLNASPNPGPEIPWHGGTAVWHLCGNSMTFLWRLCHESVGLILEVTGVP